MMTTKTDNEKTHNELMKYPKYKKLSNITKISKKTWQGGKMYYLPD